LSTNPDDPIGELFSLKVMATFKRALRVHDALAEAFLERTGQVLERDSDYTVEDLRRASRILRTQGRPPK
jgi:hypothetical protein